MAVVSAVAGHGEGLVGGDLMGRTWRVDRDGGIDTGEGEEVACPVEAIRDAAMTARRVAADTGLPQDLEWVWAEGRLFVVQARPVTTIAGMPDPAGTLRIWERSNIAESYAGVTTAATFSFIRQAYGPVYRTFCRRMGVAEDSIKGAATAFDGLLGFHQGRVTYNLLAWHALVRLLPGYRFNGPFMEQMMGVNEPLPPAADGAISEMLPKRPGAVAELLNLVRALGGWGTAMLRFGSMRQRFLTRVEDALSALPGDVDQLSADEAVAHYRKLERELLQDWDAPIVNDFLCMLSFGVLRSMCEKRGGGAELAAELVRGASKETVVSVEPALAVRQLAARVREIGSPALIQACRSGSAREIETEVAKYPDLEAMSAAYLQRFGDRCMGELKLENLSLKQDPIPLWRQCCTIAPLDPGNVPLHPASVPLDPVGLPEGGRERPKDRATNAGASWGGCATRGDLPGGGEDADGGVCGTRVMRWLGKLAGRRLADRELLRYERTRVFGRVRELLLRLGQVLYSEGRLESVRDVFHLEIHEVMGAVDGTGATGDLAGLAAVRKAEYERNRAAEAHGERFETQGAAHLAAAELPVKPEEMDAIDGDERLGLGCSSGVRRGPVRLVDQPGELTVRPLEPDEILVCRRTDPGWALVLANCAAAVVERGSALSHAAIVARELGLPAVVGVPGVMEWLADGDFVELDGRTGRVTKLPEIGS
jgi:pyruvate,water dikinase